jgi:site-specific DNA recombinase
MLRFWNTMPGVTTAYMPLDIYLRLSDLRLEDMNKEGGSVGLTYHQKQLVALAGRLGYPIGEVITENDIIDGKPKPASAWKRRTITLSDGKKVQRVIRPGFDSILTRIRERVSGGFLAIDLDRVVRDPRDLEDLIDTVSLAGANVRSLTGSITFTDGGTSAEQTQARIMLAIAKKSSDDTSRRVAAARERQAHDGIWHGGKRPFGFEDDGITIRESEAQEIRRIARKVLAGVSLRAVTQDLRARQIPTVKGGAWNPTSVKDIMIRPRNAGYMVYRGVELSKKGPWEPILQEDEYRAVCARLTVRRASSGRAARWLGSGIYFCTCGGRVSAHQQKTRPARYRCKDTGLMGGQHTSRLTGHMDRYIEDIVIEWAAQPVALKRLVPSGDWLVDVDDLRGQAAALKVRLDEKIRVNFDRPDMVTDDQLYTFTQMTNDRLKAIDEILMKALPNSPTVALAEAAGESKEMDERRAKVRRTWDGLSLGVQRAILRELVTVRLLPAKSGRHFDPTSVEVIWNL